MVFCRRIAAAMLLLWWWGVAAPISTGSLGDERQALRERSLLIAQGVVRELTKLESGAAPADEPLGDGGDWAPPRASGLDSDADEPSTTVSAIGLAPRPPLARRGGLAGRPRGPPASRSLA